MTEPIVIAAEAIILGEAAEISVTPRAVARRQLELALMPLQAAAAAAGVFWAALGPLEKFLVLCMGLSLAVELWRMLR